MAGPLLAGGYWKLPDETAETFRDGWMHTGDVAREDEDGFWYIVDRTKDMIVTGGFNVFPREVEDVVAEHPAIAQVGVIGTPDEKWGEAVTAIVVLRGGRTSSPTRSSHEIQEMVKERKGSVQAPKQVIATDALPLTGLGKPDKKALRAQYWTGERMPLASRYADLTREQLATLVPELLLIGQLIDRSGMAWCISAFGREEMAQVADRGVGGVVADLHPADAAGARLRAASRATATWSRSSRGCSSTSARRRSSWTSATRCTTRGTASSTSTTAAR